MLFVGNSLTEANELPLMVEALAAAGGHPLRAESVVYGGASLEDHWARGTQQRIAAGGFAFVVLQQGPSALPESRANLIEWTGRFDAEVRRAGGRTALFMVWPENTRPQAFPDVSASYRLAAEEVGGILLPADSAGEEVPQDRPSRRWIPYARRAWRENARDDTKMAAGAGTPPAHSRPSSPGYAKSAH